MCAGSHTYIGGEGAAEAASVRQRDAAEAVVRLQGRVIDWVRVRVRVRVIHTDA